MVKDIGTENVEVIFVTSGWARLTTQVGVAEVSAGSIVALPAGLTCTAVPIGHVDIVTLSARPEFVADQLRWLRGCTPLMHLLHRATTSPPELAVLQLAETNVLALTPRLYEVLNTSEQDRDELAFLGSVATLFADASRLLGRGASPKPVIGLPPIPRPEIVTATRILRERLTHEWTIPDLASRVALSTSQLSRLFRTELHISPAAYLRRARLDRMALLLASSGMSISQAATAVGWTNRSGASRAFQRRYGVSPREFRQAISEHHQTGIC